MSNKPVRIIEINRDSFAVSSSVSDQDLLQFSALLLKLQLREVREGHIPTAESRYDIRVLIVDEDIVRIKICLTGDECIDALEYAARQEVGEAEYLKAHPEKAA